jgi:hypothetical protein
MVSWSTVLAGGATFLVTSLVFELVYADKFDKKIMKRIVCCNDRLRRRLRSAMITFSLNVFPGGSPFVVHALDIERNSILVRALIIVTGALLLATAPLMGFVHAFFPASMSPVAQYARGGFGMGKDKAKRGWKLWMFFLRHPFTVEGEGLGNGAGLAMYSAAESLTYPDGMYDKFHDMFHDKIWQDQLFIRHRAPRARIFSVWRNGKEERRTGEGADDKKGAVQWIWKPVYATMGLGIDRCKESDKPPSDAVYMMVEQVMPSFHPCAEWFRISTLWRHEDAAPKFGYCWRTFNKTTDTRVQTDIIGGHAVLLKGGPRPFVGTHQDYGEDESDPAAHGFYDAADKKWIDASNYRDALLQAYDLALSMHRELGKELPNVGWDVMVRQDGPVFLEFNINNGFLVSDHGVDQSERMLGFFEDEYDKRVDPVATRHAEAEYRVSLKASAANGHASAAGNGIIHGHKAGVNGHSNGAEKVAKLAGESKPLKHRNE